MTHRQRKLLRALRNRHGRRKSDCILVEGLRCCREAFRRHPGGYRFGLIADTLENTPEGQALLQLVPDGAPPLDAVPDDVLTPWAATENPQGILCVFERPPTPAQAPPKDPFALILDRIAEPGNLGTILRSAWAVGLHTVHLIDGGADPFAPKTIRAGMGAQFALGLMPHPSLDACAESLRAQGPVTLWRAEPRGGVSCFDDTFVLAGNALIIGNEANGIEAKTIGPAVSIPMPGTAESLNAAQAATVLLVEAVRRELPLSTTTEGGPS